jgi:hypothetical protein
VPGASASASATVHWHASASVVPPCASEPESHRRRGVLGSPSPRALDLPVNFVRNLNGGPSRGPRPPFKSEAACRACKPLALIGARQMAQKTTATVAPPGGPCGRLGDRPGDGPRFQLEVGWGRGTLPRPRPRFQSCPESGTLPRPRFPSGGPSPRPGAHDTHAQLRVDSTSPEEGGSELEEDSTTVTAFGFYCQCLDAVVRLVLVPTHRTLNLAVH